MLPLAQSAGDEICGTGVDGSLVCWLIARFTDSELALQSAAQLGRVLQILLIVIVAWLVTRFVRASISRFSKTMQRRIEARIDRDERRGNLTKEKYRSRRFQRLHATTGVVRGVAGVLVWFVAIFMVIDVLGLSLQPVLAGAGLASVVIGFGAQQLVRDVLAGIAMLIEDQYGVGDWIDVDGVIGEVERVGLRSTSFRDLDGVLHHVLNGYIQRVGNLSQEWSRSQLDVPLGLDSDVPTAKAIIHKVATELAHDPVWGVDIIGDPEIWGVQEFGPEGLKIRLVIPTKPMANWEVNRQLRERLHHAFERAGIRMQGQLLELGGMATGYPVLNRQIREQEQDDRPRPAPPPQRRIDRADRPDVERGERSAPEDLDKVVAEDPYQDKPDSTAELRITRGREPRPD